MTRAHRLVPLLFIVALSAGNGCTKDKPAASPPPSSVSASSGIRECAQAHDSLDTAVILLTSGTSKIPEYNDCQRFIVNSAYDSLYAIFATHPKTYKVGTNVAVLVAVIRSFGGTYSALDIKPGLNCVYLFGDRRHARVVDSAAYFPCPDTIGLRRLPAPLLDSRPTVVPGFEADSNYPQVARWDYTLKHVQYIGVKCGSAWCDIGPQGFQPSPAWKPVASLPPLPARMRRNMMIKGWYDEQFLAGPPAVSGGLATVSDVQGTIFPAASLADYQDATWPTALPERWRVIAYVAMSKPSEKYLAIRNFAATSWANPATPLDPTKLNTIELCPGTKDDCKVPEPLPTCPAVANSGATNWGWARTTQPGGSNPKYRCVARWSNASMTALSLPAATRWRWVSADETAWSRCTEGCCEVH